jgi:hypothetical protein
VVLVGLAIVVVSADGDLPNTFTPRVRILSPQMAAGFREGISRSPTFRRLASMPATALSTSSMGCAGGSPEGACWGHSSWLAPIEYSEW